MSPHLIGFDWGTTSCGAYLIGADGAVLDRQTGGPGILRVDHGAFGTALDAMIGRWDRELPVILSGMIGSRQGWAEAPYAHCPATTENIVTALARIEHGGRMIALVPGLACENGGMPDVMRGEETQILGALEKAKQDGGVFLLPGTHSKWVGVTRGWITSFRTFMTGEVFGALRDHTILGRLMRDGGTDADAFARGIGASVTLGSAGALLNRLFSTRTYGLMNQLPDTALSDYLSGLLIGAEVVEATKQVEIPITIIGNPALAQRYGEAMKLLGHKSVLAPDDCVAAGHWRIARAAGLC